MQVGKEPDRKESDSHASDGHGTAAVLMTDCSETCTLSSSSPELPLFSFTFFVFVFFKCHLRPP